MKIAVSYPPLKGPGRPLLSQNRQFQWRRSPFSEYTIYPVVPAYAATLLNTNGYNVLWQDGAAEKKTYRQFIKELEKERPDLIAVETKTPVVKQHWKIIDDLKRRFPKMKSVFMGDHVSAMPEESLKKSSVDYVLTGGDYDFGLLDLADYLSGRRKNPGGGVYRWNKDKTKILKSGKKALKHNLNSLPIIDRELTKWQLYAFKNSNFYRTPGAYTMFARDCWWGKCTFCSWPANLYPPENYRVVKVEKAIAEVGNLVENYGVREIMDDSGTIPRRSWLTEFCRQMIEKGYNKRVKINCNVRFNSDLREEDYYLMAEAGFRFLLYGLESANQETLDRINKNLKVEEIKPVLKTVKKAGLWPHITVMTGYPWEGRKEINQTINFVKNLAEEGLFNSMQATILVPYPGTALFEECRQKGWLKTLDWNRYDMRESVIETPAGEEFVMDAVRKLYNVSIWNKVFFFNSLAQLKSIDGLKYISFQILKYLGKLMQFQK